MTILLRDKRSLETTLGCTVEFRRAELGTGTDTDRPVEVHATTPQSLDRQWDTVETTWFGAGDDHHEALDDASETLRVRRRLERR